jgi:hypothetical protein
MQHLQEGIMTDELLERIERLESQNKKMKVAMSALCLCLGALLTMGQTLPKKTESMGKIEAQEIVLNDGKMSVKLTPVSLVFSRGSGREIEKTTISASAISLAGRYTTEIKHEGLTCSRMGVPRFDLAIGEIGSALAFKNMSGVTQTMIDESTMVLMNDVGILSMRPEHLFLQKGEGDAFLTSSSLKIRGTDKRKAILGQVGDKAESSAASVTLLGKDDAVVWKAP